MKIKMTIRQIFAKHSNLTSLSDGDYECMMDEEDFTNAVKEFTEYHVKAALLQVSEQAKTKVNNESTSIIVDKDSILNAYNLDNIK